MKLKGFISLLIGVILITAGVCILVKKPPCLFAPSGGEQTEETGNASEKSDLIVVDTPQPNETIESPLIIKGQARGYWFFEASFPVKLLDGKGDVIAAAVAQAKSDWMTEEFVPFEATLEFQNPATEKGTLVLEKDNPSGLPENSDELRITVVFQTTTTTVKLYYYNPELDKDETGNISCSRAGLVPVERTVPVTKTPIQDAVRLLLQGELTDKEKTSGITTEYPLEGLSLEGASLNDGVLTLQFDDPNNKTGGGSCRVGILWFQIEATAKQFAGVQQVKFIPEELFQP